jgi:hypothetical protein
MLKGKRLTVVLPAHHGFTVFCLPNALPYAPSAWHDGVPQSRLGLYQTVLVSSCQKISYIAQVSNFGDYPQ